jgi:hypothetical protein
MFSLSSSLLLLQGLPKDELEGTQKGMQDCCYQRYYSCSYSYKRRNNINVFLTTSQKTRNGNNYIAIWR